jgi:predicted acyl esterase
VGPDGYARLLTDGIVRARYRKSTAGPPAFLVPGQVEKFKIDLWATCARRGAAWCGLRAFSRETWRIAGSFSA